MFSRLLTGAKLGGAGAIAALLFTACLDRPVVPQSPQVTARFLSGDNQSVISKIDLLFLIDNSQSMADKQSFLALAVPQLLSKLIDPVCVDAAGKEVPGVLPDPTTHICPSPTRRDFEPVNDIHVGIISSSLGAHGAELDTVVPLSSRPCAMGADDNDGAHLLSRGTTGPVATFQSKGFLDWNPDLAGAFRDEHDLTTSFASLVSGVGQSGCGYESQLEAIYRFLNDPAPYQSLVMQDGLIQKQGVDNAILQQRGDFLRPDSMVVVIAITDENDYSIVDGGQSWLVLASPIRQVNDTVLRSRLQGGSSACKTNPNDRCCYNCGQITIPEGCPGPDQDAECKKGFLSAEDDPGNLRATRSKFQYGIDFANPVERYIDGFTQPVLTRFEKGAKNPLFQDAGCKEGMTCPVRDPSLVFFAGIVGVPWQDIAVDQNDPSLGFQDADTLLNKGTWDLILGNPDASPPVPPLDPHMIVSVDPRPNVPGPESALGADPKNGHDWDTSADVPAKSDLQYACNFKLTTPRECKGAGEDCDCVQGLKTKNPLCQNPTTGAYGTVQYRAKAYPGIRELEVLKGIGKQGIVASICPANTDDQNAADFGYRPVMNTVLDRLRVKLRGRCLPHALGRGSDGTVPCILMEAFTPKDGATCNCSDPAFPGRSEPTSDSLTPDVTNLGPCICEIQPLTGPARDACERGDAAFGQESGWCYVDPLESRDARQCEFVKECPATERRILRYFGAGPRGHVVAMCQEQAFNLDASAARGDVCAAP